MNRTWWKDKVVYQIYPKSFYDTNGDGIGDLQGIIEKMPYLQDLGVDVLWICPFYRSPMADNGYDISDYYRIDPQFGTDADVPQLIAAADACQIKIIIDLVINHTSEAHPWFQAALADPTGEFGRYYYIREGQNGQPPTNWRALFGGNAWEPIRDTGLYYLHAFGKEQPDLNWENPIVREKLYEMVNWWLDQGIAGFRIDAITFIKKNLDFPVLEPDQPDGLALIQKASLNQPGIEIFLNELKARTFLPHNCLTVAEAPGVELEDLPKYVGEDGFFSMIFDFSLADIDIKDDVWHVGSGWTVKDFRDHFYKLMIETQKIGWNANYFENHDQPRALNKYFPPEDIGFPTATLLATLLMLSRGTPYIYQGQELGMVNTPVDSMVEYNDLSTYDKYQRAIDAGLSHDAAMAKMFARSRDNARFPFPWDASKNGGFTTGQPWLKLNPNYTEINAASQMNNDQSIRAFYKHLIALRKNSPWRETIVDGYFAVYPVTDEQIIAFTMQKGQQQLLTLINFQNKAGQVPVPDYFDTLVSNNYPQLNRVSCQVKLLPYQAIVLAN
ncbi:MAG: alpha-glucosidase [Eubacteriales bacterium]|nr:alpha-glucosidase [Eubacteriales bacterium]